MGVTAREDSGPAAAFVAAWFSLRAEDRGAAAVALHALRGRAARIVARRCRCGFAVAEDHVADTVFVMVYGIRRAPRLRISATTTLAYLCGVARNEWRWDRWRRARVASLTIFRSLRVSCLLAAFRSTWRCAMLNRWTCGRRLGRHTFTAVACAPFRPAASASERW